MCPEESSHQVVDNNDCGSSGDPIENSTGAEMKHGNCQEASGEGAESRLTPTKMTNLKWGQILLIVFVFHMALIFLIVFIVFVVLKLLI